MGSSEHSRYHAHSLKGRGEGELSHNANFIGDLCEEYHIHCTCMHVLNQGHMFSYTDLASKIICNKKSTMQKIVDQSNPGNYTHVNQYTYPILVMNA